MATLAIIAPGITVRATTPGAPDDHPSSAATAAIIGIGLVLVFALILDAIRSLRSK